MKNRTLLAALAVSPFLLVPACGEGPEPASEEVEIDFTEGVQIYGVRGIIAQLPGAGPPPTDLKIHHEHIPEFKGADGMVHVNRDGVPGMRAMVMPFPLVAEEVSLDGLEVGDKIDFEFRVKWVEGSSGPTAKWLVTAIEELPADAEVSFENKGVDVPASALEPSSPDEP